MDLLDILICGWVGFKSYQKGQETGQAQTMEQLRQLHQQNEINALRNELAALKQQMPPPIKPKF